ncbi:type IV secretory system conjugative DNA transfer family protein [Granulicella aggregans]|uniref:type IV secretory system conjugative DNA transfer family protein n=1 Tax=Granulicella aggregans TaxID=474949 RepID=UPI0021E0DF9D|nr:hypothetical protein [Granulicella aggregans]
MSFVKDLNTPLLRLSPHDVLTLEAAHRGCHIFGAVGSGKTSGSGQAIAGAYLRAGMGGVVTIAKFSDIAMWQGYAKKHGRERSIVLFDENQGFNFLDYELGRHGTDGIGSVVECLMLVLEACKSSSPGAKQSGGDPFWMESTREALRYTIPPIYAAFGSVTIPHIIRFISSAAPSVKDAKDTEWQERSFLYEVMKMAALRPKVPLGEGAMRNIIDYWGERFPAIPDKTRGNIVASVTTALDRFMHGRLQRVFCGRTTVVPEMTFHGACILLAMPTLTWNTDGVIAQKILKFFTQRAILNRNSLAPEHRERSVFLFSDEAQETVTSYDGEFLSVCRDSRACVVNLTQSLPNYYSKMGGDMPRDAAHQLVGKFGHFLFHSNSCPDTNEYAARVIGKAVTQRKSYNKGSSANLNFGMSAGESAGDNSSHNHSHGGQSSSSGFGSGSSSGSNWGSNRGQTTGTTETYGCTEAIEYVIEPGEFARMFKTGGKQNDYEVTGLWYRTGPGFKASGSNILMGVFRQR